VALNFHLLSYVFVSILQLLHLSRIVSLLLVPPPVDVDPVKHPVGQKKCKEVSCGHFHDGTPQSMHWGACRAYKGPWSPTKASTSNSVLVSQHMCQPTTRTTRYFSVLKESSAHLIRNKSRRLSNSVDLRAEATHSTVKGKQALLSVPARLFPSSGRTASPCPRLFSPGSCVCRRIRT